MARRDKKAFLSDQCKEIEVNNRMGKTRDLFKKIRDTKATFHAKMGSIKDRNGVDLTEAEDILRRGSKNTQKVKVRVKLLSCVRLLMTPWTAAHQAPLSMGFSRQEYTEELYKIDLHDPDNNHGVITHLESDILECEVKWAL